MRIKSTDTRIASKKTLGRVYSEVHLLDLGDMVNSDANFDVSFTKPIHLPEPEVLGVRQAYPSAWHAVSMDARQLEFKPALLMNSQKSEQE